MLKEEGQRLERFVRYRWKERGGKRGIVGFCAAAGITREALYSYFRADNYPRMENLGEMARVLEVPRAELVAAMDGQELSLPAIRTVVAEAVADGLDPLRQAILDAGLLPADRSPDGPPLEQQTGSPQGMGRT